LTLTAAAAGLTLIWNYDIFWHLAAGRWMLHNGRVLGTDPFSIDPSDRWVNVHWLFQLLVAGLHSLGGFGALSILKASVAAAIALLFAASLRRKVPAGWVLLCGLAMVLVMDDRLRARPELVTMLLMLVTIVLLEQVRGGASRLRLWALVPIMIVWANMHGLYVLGLGLIWSCLLGAFVDRKLARPLRGKLDTQAAMIPLVAASFAVLITPWPFDAAAQPLQLWTRISGQSAYYTYAVTELQPAWRILGRFPVAIGLVLATAAVMLANRKALPTAHVLWLGTYVILAAMAVRNVGLIGPVAGYLLAVHGAKLIGRTGRLEFVCNVLAVALGLATCFGYATGWIYQLRGVDRQFGAGLMPHHYPIATATFLRDLPLKGDVLCSNFGDGGVLIYHAWPRRRVFMDGRLEAHSLERFVRQHKIHLAFQSAPGANSVELPDEVRFIVVRGDERRALQAMQACGRFRLVYVDPVAACFARTDWPNQWMDAATASEPELRQLDLPLAADGLVASAPHERNRWYHRIASSRNLQLGELLLWLAGPEAGNLGPAEPIRPKLAILAMRYLHAAQRDGIAEPNLAAGREAVACALLGRLTPPPKANGPWIDIDTSRALYLFSKIDMQRLDQAERLALRLEQVRTLLQARQLDAAKTAMDEFMESLPAWQRVNPPAQYVKVQGLIADQLNASYERLAAKDAADMPLGRRIDAMTAKDVGLIDAAIAELVRQGKLAPEEVMLLGDLLLRKGKAADARSAYRAVELPQERQWQVELREALCDWVQGRLIRAAEKVDAIEASARPLVAAYRNTMHRRIGTPPPPLPE